MTRGRVNAASKTLAKGGIGSIITVRYLEQEYTCCL